jgi:PAS domain-containing protein
MTLQFEGEHGPRDTLCLVEEKLSLGLWKWNLKTRRMEWSRGFYRLPGLEPGSVEPSYAAFETMVHPNDVRQPGEIERIVSQAGSMEREFRIVQSGGRVRHILNRGEVLLDEKGKPDQAGDL